MDESFDENSFPLSDFTCSIDMDDSHSQSGIVLSDMQNQHQKLLKQNYETVIRGKELSLKNCKQKLKYISKKHHQLKQEYKEKLSVQQQFEERNENLATENSQLRQKIQVLRNKEKESSEKLESLKCLENKLQEVEKNKQVTSAIEHERQRTVSKQRIKIRQLEHELRTQTDDSEKKSTEISQLTKQLKVEKSKRENVSSSNFHKINKFESEVKNLSEELRDREAENNKLQHVVNNLESKASLLSDEIVGKDKTVARLMKRLREFENQSSNDVNQHETNLKVVKAEVEKLKAENQAKDRQLCKVNIKLAAAVKESNINSAASRQHNSTLDAKLKKLSLELQEKDKELDQVRSELDNMEAEQLKSSSHHQLKIHSLTRKLQQVETQLADQIRQHEGSTSQHLSEVSSLKETIRQLDAENFRYKHENDQLKASEEKLSSETSSYAVRLNSLERDNSKLTSSNGKLREACDAASDNLTRVECQREQLKLEVEQRDREIARLQGTEKELGKQRQVRFRDEVEYLSNTNKKILNDFEEAIELNNKYEREIHDLNLEVDKLRQKITGLQTNMSEKACEQSLVSYEQQEKITIKEEEMEKLTKEKRKLEADMRDVKESLNNIKKVREEMEKENSDIIKKLACVETELDEECAKTMDLETANAAMKETLVLLEKQVEDLELFNNDLIEKQNALTVERNDILKSNSSLKLEVRSLKNQTQSEDINANDVIAQLQTQLREETNNIHQLQDQNRDLERRYKLLEMNAGAIQRRLNQEKGQLAVTRDQLTRSRDDADMMQRSMTRLEDEVRGEMDRCDQLERDNTQLINRLESEKLENSHALIRLHGTGEQQLKLIDFLQNRVEQLEPNKKKKKKKDELYQAPLQYRELKDLLEDEKATNVRLQDQVNQLRCELQAANSNLKRIKHGINSHRKSLSPGSAAAISNIVRSPAPSTPLATARYDGTPKCAKIRSKPRMYHNIPHRLSTWFCNQATRCDVCLTSIRFATHATKCSECSTVCHMTCQNDVTNTCGLPGGLFQQYKQGVKATNFSPISCINIKGGKSNDGLQGRLKVLCGDDTWVERAVQLDGSQVRIQPLSSSSKPSKSEDDTMDLAQGAYIHTDVCQHELNSVAKQDLPYCFKIQTGLHNSCFPARSVYLLSSGFADKNQWIEKLESVLAGTSSHDPVSTNPKIFGNEILSMASNEGLALHCTIPIQNEKTLLGTDRGLYLFTPSKTRVSSREHLRPVLGGHVGKQIVQIDREFGLERVVVIEDGRLATFDATKVEHHADLLPVSDVTGCHLFAARHIAGSDHLCLATSDDVIVMRRADKSDRFDQIWSTTSREPCTCVLFTTCSVVIGSDKFYEIDLNDFKMDEFTDQKTASAFPISVLSIKLQDGKEEFLLCFNEFGIFVDLFGQLTRSGMLRWSRMPLSFVYSAPYLMVIQFNSVEVIALKLQSQSCDDSIMDRAFLSIANVKYLGEAITPGASYLASDDGKHSKIICCKGNMESYVGQTPPTPRIPAAASSSSSKRHLASLSSATSYDDISSTTSPEKKFRSSCDQSQLDTSRWTTSTTFTNDDFSFQHGFDRISCNASSNNNKNIEQDNKRRVPVARCVQWNDMKKATPVKPARTNKPPLN